ncbi:RNI-like protein [Artomyces pyxidatus]|uniref:RNI-like protein n=1 Tax=Artomyces pyxidatus TaxID=48021 RepID=A0ACB8SZ90_9AGAM|nr:RNI-like protein [Artomyces pyxidatus]
MPLQTATTTQDPRIFDIIGQKLRLETRADVAKHFASFDADVVEEIYLAENTFSVEAARALGDLLAKTKKLRVAGLSDIFISRTIDEIPDALTAICDALCAVPTLVELNLNNNALGGRSAHPLVPLLTRHRGIQVLKLNNCGLGPEGGKMIADALLEAARLCREDGQLSVLRVVVCGRNRLQDGSAAAWGAALAAHPKLQKVKLVNNGIREAGFGAIVAGAACCPDLRYLNLRDNNAVDVDNDAENGSNAHRGGAAVAALLKAAPKLEFLDLSDCGLGAEGAMVLARALCTGHYPHLSRLLLENSDMGEAVYEVLSEAIADRLPGLTTLSLAANDDLESNLVTAMAEVLEERGGRVVVDDECEDDLQNDAQDQLKENDVGNIQYPDSRAVDELAERFVTLQVLSH